MLRITDLLDGAIFHESVERCPSGWGVELAARFGSAKQFTSIVIRDGEIARHSSGDQVNKGLVGLVFWLNRDGPT